MATSGAPSVWRNRIVRSGDAALSEIVANPANWRTHPRLQADALSAVLADVGYVQQVIINARSGRLVDGHLRVELAASHGETSVPAVWVDLSDDEERLILATLDPIGSLAETNRDALGALLGDLAERADALGEMLAGLRPVPLGLATEDADYDDRADRFDIFEANTIREIKLHYAVDEHAEVVAHFERLREAYGEDNNATALLCLLRGRSHAAP